MLNPPNVAGEYIFCPVNDHKPRSKVTNQPGQPIKIPICAINIHKRWYQVYQVWGSIPSQESPGRKNLAMYPLVNKQFAIENGPVEIVDFPINSMVIFHSFFVNVYQAG